AQSIPHTIFNLIKLFQCRLRRCRTPKEDSNTQRNGRENGTTRVKNTPTQPSPSQALTPICHWRSPTLALWRPQYAPPAPAAGRTRNHGQ
ncbi:hypothetical protein JMJ77_0009148, partial [Colletotrichum scovillei]